MEIFLVSLIGYALGSIPTAYLVLKYKKGIDIRKEGSGNVGTLNSYEVTNSKKVGMFVLFIDLLKGVFSVLIAMIFFGNEFLIGVTALFFAVLGHCYSIWINFKGGRGLATAAGGAILLSPAILFIWLVTWFVVHKIYKQIHLANITATISVIICVLLFNNILNNISMPSANSNFIFGFSVSLIMLIILSKHWHPLKEMIKN